VLGNHPPRQCGIATFTTDLTEAIAAEFPTAECWVLAMNDVGRRHAYPERVRFEIEEADIAAYRRAADFLNASAASVLSVQHEYGISHFGLWPQLELLDQIGKGRAQIGRWATVISLGDRWRKASDLALDRCDGRAESRTRRIRT
jgi:hypothetical protein